MPCPVRGVRPRQAPAVLPDPRQAWRTGFVREDHSGWRRHDSADAAIRWCLLRATVPGGRRSSDHSTSTPAACRCRGAVRLTTASPPRSGPVPRPRSDPPALPAKLARPCARVHASAIGRRPTEPSRPTNPTFAWSISVPTCRARTTPIAAGLVPTAVPRAAVDTGSPGRAPDGRAANASGAGHRAPADTGPNTRRSSRPSTAPRARPPAAPRRPERRIAAGPPPMPTRCAAPAPAPTRRAATGGRRPVRRRGTRRDATGRALAS